MRARFSPSGEPLCRGSDWTEDPWVPSSLRKERPVGQVLYLSSYIEYDEDGEPFEEDHEHVVIQYYVRPDGTARIVKTSEKPWGSTPEVFDQVLEAGSWYTDYWEDWPKDFGSRSGTRVLRRPTPEEKIASQG